MKTKIQPFKMFEIYANAVLRGKYIAIQASLKKLEKTQIQKLTSHLKQLEKDSK